ncbi:MAG: cytochrome b/b6 domain-containing protein, partial [Fimbriimonadaceae bacterium]|nr:cytochrome b/b6 domain-containing protein [Alphaproteobacteria bacterium]
MKTRPITQYHAVAAVLHWLTALLVITIFPIGIYMSQFVDDNDILLKFQLFQWHKSIGITILLLTLLRIMWRLTHKVPPLPDNLKPWERVAARITHIG